MHTNSTRAPHDMRHVTRKGTPPWLRSDKSRPPECKTCQAASKQRILAACHPQRNIMRSCSCACILQSMGTTQGYELSTFHNTRLQALVVHLHITYRSHETVAWSRRHRPNYAAVTTHCSKSSLNDLGAPPAEWQHCGPGWCTHPGCPYFWDTTLLLYKPNCSPGRPSLGRLLTTLNGAPVDTMGIKNVMVSSGHMTLMYC